MLEVEPAGDRNTRTWRGNVVSPPLYLFSQTDFNFETRRPIQQCSGPLPVDTRPTEIKFCHCRFYLSVMNSQVIKQKTLREYKPHVGLMEIFRCAVEKELPLPRVQSRARKSTTSSKPVTTTTTTTSAVIDDVINDVTVTSSRRPSSSALPSLSAAKTRTPSLNMLTRRRGLATTVLPAVLQIALAPPIYGRGSHLQSPPPRTTVGTVPATVPAAANLTTGPSGVGDISTARSTSRSSTGHGHGHVFHRTRPTRRPSTTSRFSAVLSVTDLIGKYRQ